MEEKLYKALAAATESRRQYTMIHLYKISTGENLKWLREIYKLKESNKDLFLFFGKFIDKEKSKLQNKISLFARVDSKITFKMYISSLSSH